MAFSICIAWSLCNHLFISCSRQSTNQCQNIIIATEMYITGTGGLSIYLYTFEYILFVERTNILIIKEVDFCSKYVGQSNRLKITEFHLKKKEKKKKYNPTPSDDYLISVFVWFGMQVNLKGFLFWVFFFFFYFIFFSFQIVVVFRLFFFLCIVSMSQHEQCTIHEIEPKCVIRCCWKTCCILMLLVIVSSFQLCICALHNSLSLLLKCTNTVLHVCVCVCLCCCCGG